MNKTHLEKKIGELSTIVDVIKTLSSTLELRQVLNIIMKKIASLVSAEAWSILLIDERTHELVFEAATGKKGQELKKTRLKPGQGIAGWVTENGRPIIVPDVSQDARWFKGLDEKTKFKTKSILCAPLITKGKVLGVIEVINKLGGGSFSKKDMEVMSPLVDQAAIAIENASLYETTRKRVAELTALYEVGAAVTSILNMEKLLAKSAAVIQKNFNYYYVCIFLLEEDNKVLILRGYKGEKSITPINVRIPLDKGITSFVVKTGKPAVIPDVELEPKYLRGIGGVRSEMVVPLKREGNILGVIDIASKNVGEFTSEHLRTIEQLATQLTIAIVNARLYKEVGELAITDDLTKLYNSRYCNQYLEDAIKRAKKLKKPLSLIFLDLDYFKDVCDSYGHLTAGDTLRLAGERIKASVGAKGIVVRFGGDEYVVILPDIGSKEASEMAEKIRRDIEQKSFSLSKGMTAKLTASFGVATYPDNAKTKDELLLKADQSMYRVKETGRNRVVVAK